MIFFFCNYRFLFSDVLVPKDFRTLVVKMCQGLVPWVLVKGILGLCFFVFGLSGLGVKEFEFSGCCL